MLEQIKQSVIIVIIVDGDIKFSFEYTARGHSQTTLTRKPLVNAVCELPLICYYFYDKTQVFFTKAICMSYTVVCILVRIQPLSRF